MFGLVLIFNTAQAQNRTISGKVTDENGSAIAGVSVTVKGSTGGTQTGNDGSFNLTVPQSGKTLVFSSVSFSAKEVAINSSSSYSVSLSTKSVSLDEVVVTGYGKEKKSQFTGASTVISAKLIDAVPVGSFDQALQGRAPGMQVNSGSGQPGNSANITIRGISSISGAGVQPLYILDGVPIPAGEMQAFNANDFESVTILKDASAAALYGARGGLGVIVLTSKRGKAGAGNLTFRTQFGFTQSPNTSNFFMMNTAQALQYEDQMGSIVGAAMAGPGYLYSKNHPTYAAQSPTVKAQRDSLLSTYAGNNLDYSKILFRQGISKSYELNYSGGNAATRYFISGQLFDQEGTDLNSRLRRYATRFNLDHTTGNLSIQFSNSLGFALTNQNEGDWRGNSPRNPFQILWRAKPYENPYLANGSFNFGPHTSLLPRTIANAMEGMQNSFWNERQLKINSGLNIALKLSDDFTVRNNLGVDVGSNWGVRAVNANSYIGSLQTLNSGYLSEGFFIRTNIINTSSLVFAKKMGKHDVETGAYFEVVKGMQHGNGFALFNLDPRLTLTGQGAGVNNLGGAQNASSAKSEFGIRSYFATTRYTYNGKYTVTGSIRSDATSRILNDANKSITTWSAGFIWDGIKESFMRSQSFITDLRVRGSYGIVPNIGSIATQGFGLTGGLFGVTNYLGPQIASYGATTGFLGSSSAAQVPTTPGNPSLKIESIQKYNVGIDLNIWKNRARFTVDLYRNNTRDLFVSQPLGATTGFGGTSLPINAGVMSNRGVEITATFDIVKKKDFDFTLGFNHSINHNNIEDLGSVNEYPSGTSIIRKGLPFGSHFSQNYLGADPATGRPLYEGADGKPTLNQSAAPNLAVYGTHMPVHIGGFTADIRINRVTISALFSYQFEVMRYNNAENWTTRGTPGYFNAVNANVKMLTEQWQKPGDVKYYQSPSFDRGFTGSDVQDAKFLRFRNLNIAYSIPAIKFNGKTFIKSARFYIQGQNLAIWSPWRGLDPEDSNNISLNEFPNPKMFVTGIDINF